MLPAKTQHIAAHIFLQNLLIRTLPRAASSRDIDSSQNNAGSALLGPGNKLCCWEEMGGMV